MWQSGRLARESLNQSGCNEKLLTTKFSHWNYEQERRLIIELNNNSINDGGLRFEDNSAQRSLYRLQVGFDIQ